MSKETVIIEFIMIEVMAVRGNEMSSGLDQQLAFLASLGMGDVLSGDEVLHLE